MHKSKEILERAETWTQAKKAWRHQALSCSYCTPNRGENAKPRNKRWAKHKTKPRETDYRRGPKKPVWYEVSDLELMEERGKYPWRKA